jgi:acyl carrier protein
VEFLNSSSSGANDSFATPWLARCFDKFGKESTLSARNDVLQKVITLLGSHVPERLCNVPITENTDLSGDLGINSASLVDMVLTLEEVLNLKTGDDNYAFKTVGDIVDYVVAQRLKGSRTSIPG